MSSRPGPDGQAEETLSSEVVAELRTVGGDKLVRELMAVFAEHTPDRLRSVERSFAAGDLEATAAALHSLRSASGTVGARRLAELAGQLERAARADVADDLAAGLTQLLLEAEQVLHAATQLGERASK